MAVRSDDAAAVLRILRLENARKCSVNDGLAQTGLQIAPTPPKQPLLGALFGKPRGAEVPPRMCFVAAPLDGWTLVFANDLAFEDALFQELSRTFGEAQAFYSDTKHGGFVWRRMRGGDVTRDVQLAGGEVDVVGEGHEPEPILGGAIPSVREALCINEYDVLRVARAWSLDPNALVKAAKPGHLGALPR
jgi:hypothetical protein